MDAKSNRLSKNDCIGFHVLSQCNRSLQLENSYWWPLLTGHEVPPAHSFGSAELALDSEPEIDRASVPPSATLPEIRIHIPAAAGVRKTGGCGLRTRDAGHGERERLQLLFLGLVVRENARGQRATVLSWERPPGRICSGI